MPATSSKPASTIYPPRSSVSVVEVISAMTFALDLTEGAPAGHALRSCLLGMRLADALGMPDSMRESLFYALQLKDVGCSNNAARMTQIVGGDDRAAKAVAKMCDWTRPHRPEARTVKLLWANVLPGKSKLRRALRFARIGLMQHRNNRIMINLRCERGAEIVRALDLGHETAETVLRLDEHWDGRGYPDGLRGEAIPLASRICSVAQNLDIFAEDGEDAAIAVLKHRSGRWFDPDIVWMAEHLHNNGTLWTDARLGDDVETTRAAVIALGPDEHQRMDANWMDAVCEAFGSVVDAKSPFMRSHSLRVAEIATLIAQEMNLSPERVMLVRHAALLHDIGKLSVPNTVLDKTSDLTPDDWAKVRAHPEFTRAILERVPQFQQVAVIAAQHHERLDGTGYPAQLTADAISLESRILMVADCYTAITEERSYQKAVPPATALEQLGALSPAKLDGACLLALRCGLDRRGMLNAPAQSN